MCPHKLKVSPVFPIVHYRSLLSCLMSSACTLKFLRILRVASPLLIFLVGREGDFWVLAVLPFVMNYGRPHSMEVRIYRDHLQATLKVWVFSSSSPSGTGPIYVSPPLYKGFYLVLVSARHDLGWGYLSPSGVMSKA